LVEEPSELTKVENLIFNALKEGPKRFNELVKPTGIQNHDTLSKYLKSLEDKGLVDKEVIPGVRPLAYLYSVAEKPAEEKAEPTPSRQPVKTTTVSSAVPHIEVNIRNEGSKVNLYDRPVITESQTSGIRDASNGSRVSQEPHEVRFESPPQTKTEPPLVLLTAEDAQQRARDWITTRHHNVFNLRIREVELSYDEWHVRADFELRPLLVKAEHKSASIAINAATGEITSAREDKDYYYYD